MGKNLNINFAKAICMIVVISSHTLVANSYSPSPIAPLLGFVIPMFFYITGLTYNKYKGSLAKEYKLKVWCLVKQCIVYLIVTVIVFIAFILITRSYDFSTCMQSIAQDFCEFYSKTISTNLNYDPQCKMEFHNVFVVYWFIWSLIVMLILFLPLARIMGKSKVRDTIILISTYVISLLIYHFSPVLPLLLHIIPSFVAILMTGFFVNKYKILKKFNSKNIVLQTIINIIIFAIGEALSSQIGLQKIAHGYFAEGDKSILCWLIAMGSINFCSISFIELCKIFAKCKFINNLIIWIGLNSLEVLLTHMVFIFIINKITKLSFGRLFTETAQVTPELQLQFFIMFFLAIICCYGWVKFKRIYVIKKYKLMTKHSRNNHKNISKN